jgi:hypothetical protein
MPGNVPPDPWTDPKAYIVWFDDQLGTLLAEGDLSGATRLWDEQRDIIERLKAELE